MPTAPQKCAIAQNGSHYHFPPQKCGNANQEFHYALPPRSATMQSGSPVAPHPHQCSNAPSDSPCPVLPGTVGVH